MRGTEIVFNCPIREILEIHDQKLLEIPEEERIFEICFGEGILVRRKHLLELDLPARRMVFPPEILVEEKEGRISVWDQKNEECVASFPKDSIGNIRQL